MYTITITDSNSQVVEVFSVKDHPDYDDPSSYIREDGTSKGMAILIAATPERCDFDCDYCRG